MPGAKRQIGAVLALLGMTAVLSLAGCREDEQGRPLGYEQGVYQGAPMPEIGAETNEALRQRARNQDY